jgi:hypothetical protein
MQSLAAAENQFELRLAWSLRFACWRRFHQRKSDRLLSIRVLKKTISRKKRAVNTLIPRSPKDRKRSFSAPCYRIRKALPPVTNRKIGFRLGDDD